MRKKPQPEVMDVATLLQLGRLIPDDDREYRYLFYFLYLSGALIGEALAVQKHDIMRQLSRRTGREKLVVSLITEKCEGHPRRSVPLYVVESPPEMEIYGEVERFIQAAPSGALWSRNRRTVWKKFNKYITFEKVNGVLGRPLRETIDGQTEREAVGFSCRPHYLRHARATHLAIIYTSIQMRKFFGWKSATMSDNYANLRWEDLEL